MKIELHLVPPGNKDFGKSLIKKTLEGFDGSDYSGILYLAPTRHMVESWRKEFHPFAGTCYIPPRTATLRGFSNRLHSDVASGIVLDRKMVPLVISGLMGHGTGFSTVVADFISEMKNQFPGESIDSIRQKLSAAFEELHTPDEVSRRSYDVLNIFELYSQALKSAGAADEDDALVNASNAARGRKGADVLILDGFYEITPAEWEFIKALISAARKTLITIPVSGIEDDLSHCYSHLIEKEFAIKPEFQSSPAEAPALEYVASQSREDEIEGIARHIKSSFVSGKLRNLNQIYVAFPKLTDYEAMLDRVFKRYGIPYYPAPPAKRPYGDILSLVEAVRDGFPRLATARFLTSPYFKGIPEGIRNAVPRIALEAGTVRGKDSWLRAFKSRGLKKEGERLFDKLSTLLNASNTTIFASFINTLLDVLRVLSFTAEGEEPNVIEKTFMGLAVLDSIPGIKPPDLRSFSETIRSYLESGDSGELRRPEGVCVANLREIRGLEPRYLYLGGLKDGDLPARPELDFLLPDSVRSRLGLVDMHRYLQLQGYIFRRLVSSAEHIRLSYPSMEGDKMFLPSLYLNGADEATEKIYGDFSPEEALTRRAGEPLSSGIKEITGVKRYGVNSPIRVTDIDAFRSCPRRFFIEKVLGVEPPDIREYELDPKTIGIIVHEVMEKLIGPPLGSFEAFRQRAEKVMDGVLEDKPIDAYLKALLKGSFLHVLPDIFEIEEGLASERYVPDKAEYPIKGEPLPGIKLKGKIDRIDVRDGGSAIVLDYKTGAVNLSGAATIKRGETLQPFIYSALLRSEGARNPESVGIYSLTELRIKRVPGSRDIKEGRTLDHFIETALLYLDSTVSFMREGVFKAAPLSDSNCRQCHERPYCPYIQGESS